MDALCLEKRALALSSRTSAEGQPLYSSASFRTGLVAVPSQGFRVESIRSKHHEVRGDAHEHGVVHTQAPPCVPRDEPAYLPITNTFIDSEAQAVRRPRRRSISQPPGLELFKPPTDDRNYSTLPEFGKWASALGAASATPTLKQYSHTQPRTMDALCLEKRAPTDHTRLASESQPLLQSVSFLSGLAAPPQHCTRSSLPVNESQLCDSACQEEQHSSMEAITLAGNDGLMPWEQFEEAVDMAKVKLEADSVVVSTEVIEGPAGWTITANVEPEQLLKKREELLTVAKEALLQAADQLEGVYVLGYRTRPFTPLPHGFGATLASMSDPSRACWGTFSKGFCRNPETCRFQHPESRGAVNIVLKASR